MSSLTKLYNKLRRNFNLLFNKNYVRKRLEKRKGKCKKCGRCCNGCEHLVDKKGKKLCGVYDNRPFFCYKQFPLDEIDKQIYGVDGKCGYWFEE